MRALTSDLDIVVARDEAGLREHLAAWDDLARHAIEPNVFYESWMLLPALALISGEELHFLFIYDPPIPQRPQPLLIGFFPLVRGRLHPLLPFRVYTLWRHLYAFLCIPLLRKGQADRALVALLRWLAHDRAGAALCKFDLVTGDGPFARTLTEVLSLQQRSAFLVESYLRAQIIPGESALHYLTATLASRRLKDLRRKERSLEEKGNLQFRTLQPEENPTLWADQFLELEQRGWKGKEKTAIACEPAHADFFRSAVRVGHARGQVQILGLFLDDQPVALKCNFLSPPGARGRHDGGFGFKIAFDESHSVCSPGLLLEKAAIEHLHTTRTIDWLDSCTVPEQQMFNRLWLERRIVQTLFVASERVPGDLLVALMPLGRWLKRSLRWPFGRRTRPAPGTAAAE